MDIFPVIETDLLEESPAELPEEDEDSEPEPEPKEKLDQSSIFVDKPKPHVKAIIEDVIESDDEVLEVLKVPENVKPKPVKEKKPRKPMSDAQKEHLRKGREKALADRRAKAKEKQELKDLQDKKKKKELKELKDYVSDEPVFKKEPVPKKPDIDIEKHTQNAVRLALEEHEKQRQIRKQKKKEKQAEDNLKDMCINASLYQKPAPKYGDDDFFNNCFN